jgi:hypothetical protein
VAALESAEGDGTLGLCTRMTVSCRTGPLRVARALRDLYTGLSNKSLHGSSRCSAHAELVDSKLGLDAI